MHEMQAIVVCLSCDLNWLHCAKTAERIQILFGLNSLGGPRNIVLDGNPDPPQRGGGEVEHIWPIVDPQHVSGMAEHTDFKFCMLIEGWVP